jgi:branched-subunit amino acid aminotransferase/4-amino-4-deoxychorismate lyase
MDSLVFHNGIVLTADEAKVSATLAGLQYGWGVFTTLRIINGSAFVFDRHWERLVKHAEKARVAVFLDKEAARQALDEIIKANSVVDGRARFTLLKGSFGSWRTGLENETDVLIFTSTRERQNRGREITLTISPYRLLSSHPLAGVKRTSMIENLIAFDEARTREFDEAVMLNERGEIVSATAGNIFWSDGKELYTPSLSTGCIAGITRNLILEAARRINIHAVEGSFPLQSIGNATEVFLTSTSRGITPVKTYDIRVYDSRTASMTRNILREYKKIFVR